MGSLITAHVFREQPDFSRLAELPTSIGYRAYLHRAANLYLLDAFRAAKVPQYPFQTLIPSVDIPLEFPPALEPLERLYSQLALLKLANAFKKSYINTVLLLNRLLHVPVFSFASDDDQLDFACSASDGALSRLKCRCGDLVVSYDGATLQIAPLLPAAEEDEGLLTDTSTLGPALPGAEILPRETPWNTQLHAIATEELQAFAGIKDAILAWVASIHQRTSPSGDSLPRGRRERTGSRAASGVRTNAARTITAFALRIAWKSHPYQGRAASLDGNAAHTRTCKVRRQFGCYGRSRLCASESATGVSWPGMVTSKIHARLLAFVVIAELIFVGRSPLLAQKTARTADGRPDLQGMWLNNTATPLQRDKDFADKAFFTEDEALDYEAHYLMDRAAVINAGKPFELEVGADEDVFDWGHVLPNRRTSFGC